MRQEFATNKIAKKILLTLAYTTQFEFPLTMSELHTRLITRHRIAPSLFNKSFKNLISQGSISTSNFLTLRNGGQELPQTRLERQTYSAKKWSEITSLIVFLHFVPGISGVLVTGSLAMNNATKDDDVDFLIITKPHMLWLLRPLVVGYSWVFGKRRSWQNEEKNSWCFNFWLDENHLQLPPQSRSIYTAYELFQAKWVVGTPELQAKYYSQNKWARQLLSHYYHQVVLDVKRQFFRVNPVLFFILSCTNSVFVYIFFPFNLILYVLQHLYMLPHKTTERVGYGFAFFHPRNTKQLVFRRWKETLQRL